MGDMQMKKRRLFLLGAFLATMTIGTTASADGDRFKSFSSWWWGTSRYQTADVKTLSAFGNSGAATLTRERNKISGRVMAKVPTAGDAYTVWFLVVNNPSACKYYVCLGPLDDDDFLRPETPTTVFNANGAISASDGDGGGVINVDFEVEAGRLPEGLFILEGSQRGLRYRNGFGALVVIVIDQHPPVADGASWIRDLTTTEPPGGANTSVSLAGFLPCPKSRCPADPFATPP